MIHQNVVGGFMFWQFYTPLSMEENKAHFKHLMLFFYRKGKSTIQATNMIFADYGENVEAKEFY